MPAPRYRVALPPPERPVLLYDGDCRFCQLWADRWHTAYAGRLTIAPAQVRQGQFPEIPAAAFAEALQLVEPDGAVYSGAWAALRARACGRGRRGILLPLYEAVPGAAALLEFGYRIVARNRRVFSILMR